MRSLGREKLRKAGFPGDCADSEEGRDLYCRNINKDMEFKGDMRLEPGDIVDDAAACKFWKNAICYFCGVWAMDSNEYTEVQLVHSATMLRTHMKREGKANLVAWDLLSELVAAATFSIKKRKAATSRKGNCVINAFITSHLRVVMYRHIRTLAEAGYVTLFTSTDSLLFVGPKDLAIPLPIGSAHGQFKPVLPVGADIRTFLSVGPSNYLIAYTDATGQSQQKASVQGLTATRMASNPLLDRVLFKSMLDGLYEKRDCHVTLLQAQLRKVNKNGKFFLKQRVLLAHRFRSSPLKKRVLRREVTDDGSTRYYTLPFGFKPHSLL